ncbi:MAG: head-tail connector protein [Planctomycetota bacterium]
MAASTDLTTLAKVKAYLGVSGSGDDTLLEALIDSVSEAIEHYCGREFAAKERTEFHDGGGAASLVLRCRPVQSIASLRDDPARLFPEGSEIAPAGYVFYPEAGIVVLDGASFSDGRRNVRVTYTAGFSAVPPAVEQAANILAAHFYNRGRQGGDGLASESLGAYTVSYNEAEWPASAQGLLFEYREVEV